MYFRHYSKMVAWGHRIKCRVLDSYSLEMVACGRRGIVQVLDPPPFLGDSCLRSSRSRTGERK